MKCGPDPGPDICLTCGQQWPCQWAELGGHSRAHRCPEPGGEPGQMAYCGPCGLARQRVAGGGVAVTGVKMAQVSELGRQEPSWVTAGWPDWTRCWCAACPQSTATVPCGMPGQAGHLPVELAEDVQDAAVRRNMAETAGRDGDMAALIELNRDLRRQLMTWESGDGEMVSARLARKRTEAAVQREQMRVNELQRAYREVAGELARLKRRVEPPAPPGPAAGSERWWREVATAKDLEPVRSCSGCGLAVPAPDAETGLCRFCADERAGEQAAPLVVTSQEWSARGRVPGTRPGPPPPARPVRRRLAVLGQVLVRLWLALAVALGSAALLGWVLQSLIWAVGHAFG